MSILGIVGGIAPASTVDYYQLLVTRYRDARPDGSYPRIIINSIDLQRMLGLVGAGDLDGFANFLVPELERLARAGAEAALFASNTPHLILDRLAARSPVPLISIVDATAAEVRRAGHRVLGLIGTRFTMEGGFYDRALARDGVRVVVPDPAARAYIHEHYLGELAQGRFLPETRVGMLAAMLEMRRLEGIEAVILGGTELPLLFRDHAPEGLPLLDTTSLHVEAALRFLLDGSLTFSD